MICETLLHVCNIHYVRAYQSVLSGLRQLQLYFVRNLDFCVKIYNIYFVGYLWE